jgi:hypothetical protein
MKLYRVEQGSAEWYRLKLGTPSASNFDRIVTAKGNPSRQAKTYMYKLICERLLNETQDDQLGFVKWVEHGRASEPNAVAAFEFINDVKLEPGGFVTSDDGRIGASPDRLFKGRREAMEVKCPAPWTQLGYLLDGLGEDHMIQVQGQIFVGEFDAVHVVSFHPQMPLFHKIVLPDPGFQRVLGGALSAFCELLELNTTRARALGAYAVARRVETPADVAYQRAEDAQPRLVDDGDMGDASP